MKRFPLFSMLESNWSCTYFLSPRWNTFQMIPKVPRFHAKHSSKYSIPILSKFSANSISFSMDSSSFVNEFRRPSILFVVSEMVSVAFRISTIPFQHYTLTSRTTCFRIFDAKYTVSWLILYSITNNILLLLFYKVRCPCYRGSYTTTGVSLALANIDMDEPIVGVI